MRVVMMAFLILCVATAGPLSAGQASTDTQPPQLLGVWFGTYQVGAGADAHQAEMWMEVSYQLSVDGWDIRGHNRWNVIDKNGAQLHGQQSLGSRAEYFDRFSGHIAPDRQSVTLTEGHRRGNIRAHLEGTEILAAAYYPEGSTRPGFSVRLKRIDTHYSPTDLNVLGIDISHHSGSVDWPRVKAQGFRFAYVKASEGVDNPDAMFETHWKALRDLGMARGAYHFYVTEDDPVAQAKFFASRLRHDPGTLPPAVDIELLGRHTTGDLSTVLLKFLETLKKQVGVKPLIYTNSTFWDQHYHPAFSDYALWLSEYGVKMPKVPFGWKSWLFWQTAESRKIDGVEKDADISMIHPSIDLRTLRPKTKK